LRTTVVGRPHDSQIPRRVSLSVLSRLTHTFSRTFTPFTGPPGRCVLGSNYVPSILRTPQQVMYVRPPSLLVRLGYVTFTSPDDSPMSIRRLLGDSVFPSCLFFPPLRPNNPSHFAFVFRSFVPWFAEMATSCFFLPLRTVPGFLHGCRASGCGLNTDGYPQVSPEFKRDIRLPSASFRLSFFPVSHEKVVENDPCPRFERICGRCSWD